MGDVLEHHRLLSEVLPKRVEALPPEDRARAQRLATMALRVMDRADRMLGPAPEKRPPARVLNILRLGVAEICESGEAAHGVVNAAVEIARADRKTAGHGRAGQRGAAQGGGRGRRNGPACRSRACRNGCANR